MLLLSERNGYKMKISGTVIWYNPKKEQLLNIKTYIDYIDKLYIVDNSENNNCELLRDFYSYKIEYIPNFSNLGIAAALNIACEKAYKENCKWILTMDQDSIFSSEDIKNYIELLKKNDKDNIGIMAPRYELKNILIPKNKNSVITSGSFLNLIAYKKLGGFLEELFIDEVDHEMCYRMIRNNYKLLQFDDIVLHHELGNTAIKKMLFKNFSVTNHAGIRRYYITRNKLYINKIYPEYTRGYKIDIIKQIVKIIFWEDDKKEKIKYIMRGIKDYKSKKMGKYEE